MKTKNAENKINIQNIWLEAIKSLAVNDLNTDNCKNIVDQVKIRNLEYTGRSIKAIIDGENERFINLNITFKSFDDEIINKIRNIISLNPLFTYELSLNIVSVLFTKELEKNNIFLIPTSFDEIEFESNCTCEEKIYPYIIAVLLNFTEEIEVSSNRLIKLRGIKTDDIIEASNFELFTDNNNYKTFENKFIPSSEVVITSQKKIKNTIDLQDPNEYMDSIFYLLPNKPDLNTRGDFKSTLVSLYDSIQEKLETYSVSENHYEVKNSNFYLFRDKNNILKVFITPSNSFLIYLKSRSSRIKSECVIMKVPEIDYEKNKLVYNEREGVIVFPETFIDYFNKQPFNVGKHNTTPSSRFFSYVSSLAFKLVNLSLYIPEVVVRDNEGFKIRYVPFIKDENIRQEIKYLEEIMPECLYFKENTNIVLDKTGSYDVLSLFITNIIHYFKPLEQHKAKNSLSRLFTTSLFHQENTNSNNSLAIKTSNWLKTLSVRKNDISPVLRIEKNTNKTFKLYIDVRNKEDNESSILPLKDIFSDYPYLYSQPADTVRSKVNQQILIVSDFMPVLREILYSKGTFAPIIDLKDITRLITQTINILNLLGIDVIVPKELKNLSTPKLQLKAKMNGKTSDVKYLSLNEILNFSYEIALGDKTISIEEFKEMVETAEGIINFNDQYILLNAQEAKNLLSKLKKSTPKFNSPLETLHAVLTESIDGISFKPDEAIRNVIDNVIDIKDISPPEKVAGILRPYQERGFKWLYSNAAKMFGSCIADDMGLGKTLQVLTVLLKYKEEKKLNKPALVICPTTLIGNWAKEIEKFTPGLKSFIYYGNDRVMPDKHVDVIITSYGILRMDVKLFTEKEWSFLIIDEAQNIKNPDTDQTRAVKAVKADSFIAVSGTPVENRLTELWSIFDFINAGYLGDINKFKRQYATPIEKYRSIDKIEQLKIATSPFVLRRLKTDKTIIDDLPDKIVSNEYCYLQKEQAALYQKILDENMKIIEGSSGINRKGNIFKLITSLKQICNHPAHFTKNSNYSKELSGKTLSLISLLEKIIEKDEKVLVFTQYKQMGDILVDIIKKELNEDSYFFHGSLQRNKREELIENFQNKDNANIMILSLKAGGTGLNLTRATNVIHYDLWWNPAVENQATDRTYRIGQDKNVFVHRLITIGTFEEKIDEIINSKKELAELTVSQGEKWITEFTNDQLRNIFSFSAD